MPSFAEIQASDEWQKWALPAHRYYSEDEQLYHNWNHALDVAAETVELATECNKRGYDLPIGMLAVAAAWHDAGYHNPDYQRFGDTNKELFAARLAGQFLYEHGAGHSYTAQVRQAIRGTAHREHRKGWNMLIVHRADVANIGGPYETFVRNSYKIWGEESRAKPELTYPAWQAGAKHFIDEVIAETPQELAVLGFPSRAVEFCAKAQSNLDQLMTETEESIRALGQEAA